MPCCRHASSSVAPSGTRTVCPSIVTSTRRRGASRNTALICAPRARLSCRLLPVPASPVPASPVPGPADQAELDGGGDRADRGLAKTADGGVARDRGDVVEQREFLPYRAERSAAHQPAQQFLLADRPYPAWHALPA